jgi:hypothetical protein
MDVSDWDDQRILNTLCSGGDLSPEQGDRVAKAIKEGNI